MGTIVGRDHDLDAINAHLASARLVSVVGPGGVGKTTVAEQLCDGLSGPTDWIDLAAVRHAGDEVYRAVLRMLDAPSIEAWALVHADDHPLVVVDNCEHVLDAARETVSDLLATHPTVRVLATSRAELGVPGEIRYRLAPLPTSSPDDGPSAAARLFVQASRERGAGWPEVPANLIAIEDIVDRLDGLPLAIELAAARSSAIAPAEFAAMLGPTLDVLHDDLQPVDHQRSLRKVIADSFERIDHAAQHFLATLAPLTAPFDLELAATIAETDRILALEQIDLLVRESLVVALHDDDGGTRFRLLEPVREFALEYLNEAGLTTAVIDRYIGATAAIADGIVARAAADNNLNVASTVLRHATHLVSALELTLETDDTPDRAYRLVLPLFAPSSAPRPVAAALGSRVVERWGGAEAPLRAEALAVIALCALNVDQRDLARTLATSAYGDPNATPLGRLLAARTLGALAAFTDDYATAGQRYAEAIAESVAIGGPFEIEIRATLLGLDVSLDAVAELNVLAERAAAGGDDISLGWVLAALSHIYLFNDRIDDAARSVERNELVSERSPLPWSRSAAARARAILESHRAPWPVAASAWRRSLDLLVGWGDIEGVAVTIRTAAAAAERGGEHGAADQLWLARPIGRANTLFPLPFMEDERAVAARCGPPPAVGIAEAVERARAVLGDSAAPSVESENTSRFAPDLEIDMSRRQLRRAGAVEHVEPQVFDVLAYLAANAGRMVSREELMDEVWGTRFVTAAAVSSRIRSARAAAGDDGKRQAVIRTVHGRGFEFVAEPVRD
ncbi:MAG: winged helix-turn-helix domain-containing protein [Actinomycetota bacterium]